MAFSLVCLRKGSPGGRSLAALQAPRRPNTCKTCALGMGGQRGGHGQRARPLSPRCARSRSRRWPRTSGGPCTATSSTTSPSRSCAASPRASWRRPGGSSSRCTRARRQRTTGPIELGGGAATRIGRKLQPTDARREPSSTSAAARPTRRGSCSSSSRGSTAPTTSTTARTTATRPRAWARAASTGSGHGHGRARGSSSAATCSF